MFQEFVLMPLTEYTMLCVISVSNIILVSALRQQKDSAVGHKPRGHLRITRNSLSHNLEVIFCQNQDKRYLVIISVIPLNTTLFLEKYITEKYI